MTYVPKFPNAPHNYDAQNEAQFRSVVTRALSDTFGGINNRLSSGTGFPTSILGWTHDIGFAATDNDTVSWGTGNITLTDGTTYNIASGNTGNMTTVTYIFLDIGVSATTLQVTTTATDTVGANRILVAVAQDVEAGKDAQFQVFGGADDQKLSLVTADVVATDTLTANEIAANTITATEIAAGTITANEILANTITAAEIAAGTITANEIEADTITANEIAAVTITGDEIASLNISTKTITADTGTIGGWTLSSSALSAGNVSINASTERILMGAATSPATGVGIFMGLDVADYEFRVGDPGGAYMHWDGTNLTINSPSIIPAPVLATPSIYGWAHDMTFSATDNDTVAWSSGTISLADSITAYSIGAGNTGNMTVTTYIYLDAGVSTVALQTTTTAATAVGANKILVAVAKPSVSGTDATYLVYGGGDDFVNPVVDLGSQVSGTLTSAFADAGLINSNVTINADGTLSGAGGGQASLASLPGTVSLATQVSGSLSAAFADAGLINSNVTINSDGTLTGAGGGQASLTSLPGQVQVGSIAANAVTAGTIAALAVTAGTIAAGAVTASEISAGAVTSAKIAAGAVVAGKIAALAVTAGTIDAGVVDTTELAAGAVTAAKIAAGTITASEIASNTITANEIASNTITAAEIASGTITASQIATGTITATQITGTTLSAIYADMGTLTAGKIDVGSIEINADTERILFGAATAPLTGTGVFLGKDGSDYEFRCGDPTGAYIHWNGSSLTVGGTIVSDAFTASDAVFDGSVTVKANDGYNRVKLWSSANYGAISFYDGTSANEAGSIWGSSSYGLRLAAVDGNIEFEGSTGFGSVSSAVLYNNGDVFGPKLVDGTSRGTTSNTSYVDISDTLSWAGDGSFIGSVTEFSGKVTGTNSTKGVRITAGGSSAVLFQPAAGDTGSWHVKVMIAEITTSSQRVVAQWTAPDGTSGVYNATRAINTLTTAFTLVCGGYTANASDEVTCNLTISRSMCNDGS